MFIGERKMRWISGAVAWVAAGMVSSSALALVLPSPVEDFSVDTSNWGSGATSSLTAPNRSLIGGVNGDGDAYITFDKSFTSTSASTIFRCQDPFNSSGDVYFGNWQNANITAVRFFVKHANTGPTSFFVRIAVGGNFPAMTVPVGDVPANTWTQVTVPVTFADYITPGSGWTFESFDDPEPPPADNYNFIFSDVHNVQILAESEGPASPTSPKVANFSIDKFSLIPEPASLGLLAGGAMALGVRRRRIRAEVGA